jgi:Gluconate 2-dehydrogenase subunit 3
MTSPAADPDVETLTALANAIIPPDHRDAGAAAVDAGPRLADRMRRGIQAPLYELGLRTARDLCARVFERSITDLSPAELHELMQRVAETVPAFFKQWRLDVTALYLSDPAVWERIGFPGPSIETGGHPDFDQPQAISPRLADPSPEAHNRRV